MPNQGSSLDPDSVVPGWHWLCSAAAGNRRSNRHGASASVALRLVDMVV